MDSVQLFNTNQKINGCKNHVHTGIKKQYHQPVIFPGRGNQPMIQVKIAEQPAGFTFYVVTAVAVNGALPPLFSIAVKPEILTFACLIRNVFYFAHIQLSIHIKNTENASYLFAVALFENAKDRINADPVF